jgi:DNA mismatch repair protein MutS
MEQYARFKRQHPDAILFFRMGDFYEMFHDDAREASRLLGLTLTSRNHGKSSGEVPLAGVPHHAAESYLAKLIRMGRKVAICEQVEDPKKAKGVVKRDVVEVVSPGTALADSILDGERNNYAACLCPNGDQVGMAVVDVSTGDFCLDEIPLAELSDELTRLTPSELILSDSTPEDWPAGIQHTLPGVAISRLEEWQFEYKHGYEILTEQFKVHSLKGFDCEDLDLGVRAGGAALEYLRQNQRGAVEHINRLRRRRRGDHVFLDATAQRNLDLVANQHDGSQTGSLLEVLDRTCSSMGARLLRQWVTAPLSNPEAIRRRLDAVAALVDDRDTRSTVRETLSRVDDLERIMARICCRRANARDLVGLARSLALVPALCARLETVGDPLLKLLAREEMPSTDSLVETVGAALVDDPPVSVSDGGLFREGYHEELDSLREIAAGGRSWIAELQVSERQRTGIASLKVGFNQVFGYYIEVSKTNLDRVPEEYTRKQTLANAERYITPQLKEYEVRVLSAQEQIAEIESSLFFELRERLTKWSSPVQQCARSLAQIDVVGTFAEVSEAEGYTRPDIDDSCVIAIEGGRHPVVERQLPTGRFVPNDVHLNSDEAQILLITGPNMAGKSTAIRQVGLIVLLAQVGSFVPARSARIGAVDRIFTRVGASDNLIRGESTFMVEMSEASNILNNATSKSLILLDELGRGTSTFDGLSIAWAVLEHLHGDDAQGNVGPRTLFATHYHELTQLERTLPRLRNFNVAVHEEEERVVFLHRLAEGPCDRSYGINVAEMAGMPESVLVRAKQILARLEAEQITTVPESVPIEESGSQIVADGSEREGEQDWLSGLSQMDLFGGVAGSAAMRVLNQLRDLDPDQTTPLEALEHLARWRDVLGETENDNPDAAEKA